MRYSLEKLYGYAVLAGLVIFALFEVWALSGLTLRSDGVGILLCGTLVGAVAGTALGNLIRRTWQFAILGTLAGFDFAAVIIGVGSTWK